MKKYNLPALTNGFQIVLGNMPRYRKPLIVIVVLAEFSNLDDKDRDQLVNYLKTNEIALFASFPSDNISTYIKDHMKKCVAAITNKDV